jgi:capsular polysaccharide transport system permease protein
MTTKPKTRKFRIRRSSPLIEGRAASVAPGAAEPPRPALPQTEPANDASAAARPQAAPPRPAVPPPSESREDAIAAIRQEGLTGRQLRMARRLAQKHGLAPTSDYDAVRQLRNRGIDPFDRANVLELVVPEERPAAETGAESDLRIQLPQTVARRQLPAKPQPPQPFAPEARVREIAEIQRDIARRRRRKTLLLMTRLAFFVLLPTLMAGYYFIAVATPMYATKSEFVIQQSEPATAGGLGGLFSGTGFATSQDSITVQSYLTSRDAMLRLDDELGFKSHFMDPAIDPIQRLPEDASNEDAYDLYQRNVEIGYDPTEGIIKMEVVAADPAVSAEWSRRLISYAEEQVDSLTERLRRDQMAGARESFEEAEAKMVAAQQRVLALQEQLGVLDPTAETGALMSQITTFETQLAEKRLQLQQLLDNARPNQARVDGVQGDINRLNALIADLRSQLTSATGENASLARVNSELRVAQVDLETRTMMMQAALQQLETARIEANRQTRYLSMGVQPVAPDEPTYPRAFENTLLAFLIFAGIYLMVSLTASILRDQVSG